MTPLQHAAFKGRTDVCQLLLENGADVNSNHHENGYSALHFAALSGNPAVTRLILEAGAKIDHLNSVNRTAAQMAAFVGQHQCVRTINNFFPKERLEKFTKQQGFETEPKLPPNLQLPFLRLINSTNIHPVKVAMFLKDNKELVLDAYKVAKVLDILVEESMKSRDTNDVLAIKCHYFATLIRQASKFLKKPDDTLDGFVKSLVKGRDVDGFPEMQERIIRQCLKEFPYIESQLLQQLVQQIAPVKIGDAPTALTTLVSGIYGPVWEDDSSCWTCGELKAEKKCSACKCVSYCDQVCQKLHWPTHKKFCKSMAEAYQTREQERLKEEAEKEQSKKEMEKLEAQIKQTSVSEDSEGNMRSGETAVQQEEVASSQTELRMVAETDTLTGSAENDRKVLAENIEKSKS
ncbi:hypothetical protein C0Q70_04334 [Pomacea canaliculata]|uniref:MYND-type domain-containing protein n=2 Tax=Pomacea canaliculata TaxID=400727 RepID=A0A2T7PV82_POMCA|nr:hypothetical protein C0Q70_04334 [Pomacea canaliculata]